jgi:flagellar protein FliO/FliZ
MQVQTRISTLSAIVLTVLAMPAGADPGRAAAGAVFAAPAQFAATSSGFGVVRMVLALALVLAAVFAAAALMRRLRVLGAAAAPNLQVLAQVSFGARERAVLLRAGDQQLLVGVAPGNVRLLCALPDSLPAAASTAAIAAPALPNFRELLRRSLGR